MWTKTETFRSMRNIDSLGDVHYRIVVEELDNGHIQATGHAHAILYAYPVGYMDRQFRTMNDAKLDIESTWLDTLTALIEQSAAEQHELNDMMRYKRAEAHQKFFGQMSMFT